MKRRTIVSLAFIIAGIALAVIILACRPSPLMQAILACILAASGFGTYGVYNIQAEENWRSFVAGALFGILLVGFDWMFALFFIVAGFGKMLLSTEEDPVDTAVIQLPPDSGLALLSSDHVYYQIFRGQDRLYLVYLGSRNYTPDVSRALQSEDDYKPDEMDRIIPFRKIRAIQIESDGSLRIRSRRGGEFAVLTPATPETAAAYLEGLPCGKASSDAEAHKPATKAQKNASFAILLGCELTAIAWTFWDTPATLLAAFNLFMIVFSFGFFCLFHRAFASSDEIESLSLIGWLVSSIPFFLHFYAYNFVSFPQFITPVLILAACALLLFFAFNVRNLSWGKLIASILVAVPISLFVIGNFNVLLDGSTRAEVQTATVQTKPWHDGFLNFDPCSLRLGDPFNRSLKVTQDVYNTVDEGYEVEVVTYAGAFGVDYLAVERPEQ